MHFVLFLWRFVCCGKVQQLQIHDASIVVDGANSLFNVSSIVYANAGSGCGYSVLLVDQRLDTSGAHTASFSESTGGCLPPVVKRGLVARLIKQLHLTPRLRMSGVIPHN